MPRLRPSLLLLLATLLAGCGPKTLPAGAPVMAPQLDEGALVARDGAKLPIRRWTAASPAKADIIALHGYTDYSAAFAQLGPWLADHGYDVLAYDQRGFGATPHPGIWAGSESLVADLEDAILVARQEHPDRPLYVLGESMGGSVAMVAAAEMPQPPDGLILAAPGVRDELPWRGFWDVAIWLGAHAAPGYTVDVDRNGPSPLTPDSADRLRNDPLVSHQIRADSYQGLIQLADLASAAAAGVEAPVLMLYGGDDGLVRKVSICAAIRAIPGSKTLRLYPGAPHLLLHWQEHDAVWQDLLQWLDMPAERRPGDVAECAAEP